MLTSILASLLTVPKDQHCSKSILDSAYTSHVTHDENAFVSLTPCQRTVIVENNDAISSQRCGDVLFVAMVGGTTKKAL